MDIFSALLSVFLAQSSLQPKLVTAATHPAGQISAAAPVRKTDDSRGVDTTAVSAIVIDVDSGEVLFSKSEEKIFPIASITKLMSALVLNDQISDWKKTLVFLKQDRLNQNVPNLFPGEKFTLEQLLNVGLVGSDNDAIAALVRATGLNQEGFVSKMNEKAESMGLFDTRFVDPTGLSPYNTSSAKDITKLLKAALSNDRIRAGTTMSTYKLYFKNGVRVVHTTDYLLTSSLNRDQYHIIGGKTGHINESGYNLALQVQNKTASVIAVVLGSQTNDTRFEEIKNLISWSFEHYDWPPTKTAGL